MSQGCVCSGFPTWKGSPGDPRDIIKGLGVSIMYVPVLEKCATVPAGDRRCAENSDANFD